MSLGTFPGETDLFELGSNATIELRLVVTYGPDGAFEQQSQRCAPRRQLESTSRPRPDILGRHGACSKPIVRPFCFEYWLLVMSPLEHRYQLIPAHKL